MADFSDSVVLGSNSQSLLRSVYHAEELENCTPLDCHRKHSANFKTSVFLCDVINLHRFHPPTSLAFRKYEVLCSTRQRERGRERPALARVSMVTRWATSHLLIWTIWGHLQWAADNRNDGYRGNFILNFMRHLQEMQKREVVAI